ncbi:MAG: phosphatidate cytidylyltransferase [Erysipelotrichaceae bacterium]|nr:phosphatidate cytidylyltransferase [Erysipelotrichaceae bacterium]
MKQRIISGAVIAVVTIAAVLLSGYFFDAVMILLAFQACREVIMVRKNEKFSYPLFGLMFISLMIMIFLSDYRNYVIILLPVILGGIAVFDEKLSFEHVGLIYFLTGLIGYGLSFMRMLEYYDMFLLGALFVVCYLTDTFAYFTGMKFGKHKLNERISPKKTIEGSVVGWIIGSVCTFIWCFVFNLLNPGMIVCCIVLPVVSQIGDLIFSMIKRHFDIKDFSNFIPGHGGILDRYDSILTTAVVFGVIFMLFV